MIIDDDDDDDFSAGLGGGGWGKWRRKNPPVALHLPSHLLASQVRVTFVSLHRLVAKYLLVLAQCYALLPPPAAADADE